MRKLMPGATDLRHSFPRSVREAVGRDTTHLIKQPRLKRSPSHRQTIDGTAASATDVAVPKQDARPMLTDAP